MQTTQISTNTISDQQKLKIQKVAREYESLFTSMMLKEMRKTVGDNPLVPESFGTKVYTEMLNDEYAKMVGSNSTLGLADLIAKELEKIEVRTNTSSTSYSAPGANLWMIDNAFIPQTTGPHAQSPKDKSLSSRINKWNNIIEEASQTHNVDKNLIRAVIAQESGGNPYAVSKAGAKGLMQLMDTTAGDLGVANSFSPRSNVFGGTKYLRSLLDKYNDNEQLALASYNAGPAAVDKYKGVPPYAETQKYVESVIRLKTRFSDIQED